MAREMAAPLLVLAVTGLIWFGSSENSQAQQSSFNQSPEFGQFRHVSSPLRPSRPALRPQAPAAQREQDRPESAEPALAEALPGRGNALEDIEQSLRLLEDYLSLIHI